MVDSIQKETRTRRGRGRRAINSFNVKFNEFLPVALIHGLKARLQEVLFNAE